MGFPGEGLVQKIRLRSNHRPFISGSAPRVTNTNGPEGPKRRCPSEPHSSITTPTPVSIPVTHATRNQRKCNHHRTSIRPGRGHFGHTLVRYLARGTQESTECQRPGAHLETTFLGVGPSTACFVRAFQRILAAQMVRISASPRHHQCKLLPKPY